MNATVVVDFDLTPIEAGDQNAIGLVDALDPAKIAVEDLAVVIVFGLHDLVARSEGRAKALDFLAHVRIEGVLEIGVERLRAVNSALHRAQRLNIADPIEPEASGRSLG
jgi:hypothetical protein